LPTGQRCQTTSDVPQARTTPQAEVRRGNLGGVLINLMPRAAREVALEQLRSAVDDLTNV
jgi:hypothetical protein